MYGGYLYWIVQYNKDWGGVGFGYIGRRGLGKGLLESCDIGFQLGNPRLSLLNG